MEQDLRSLFLLYSTGILSTLVIAGIFFLRFSRRPLHENWPKFFFISTIVFYSTYILSCQILKLYTFKYYSDFTVWLEIFSNHIEGHGLITTLQKTSLGFGNIKNYFAQHFVPLIYVLSFPLYFIQNVPVYLIFLQTVILVSAVIPLYLFAKEVFHNKNIGYLFAASFLFFPTTQYINLYDFEFLRLSITPLLFCFYFLYKKKYYAYYLFLFLSICIREEVALTTIFIGVYGFFVMKERIHGVATSVISFAYFLAVIKFVMPHFAGEASGIHEHIAFENFAHLGNSPLQIVVYMITHPIEIIGQLLDKIKIANFLMYVLPLLFTCFFSPAVFFIPIGNFLLNFLSKSVSHHSYILYYLSPTIPFLFLSAILGVRNLSDRILPFLKEKSTLFNIRNTNSLPYNLVTCIFISCVVSNFFFGPSPLSLQFWLENYKLAPYKTHNFHISQYVYTDHHTKALTFIPLIPENASVSAEHFFLPHLYRKKTLMQFPIIEGADYVLIDKTHPVKFGTIDVDPFEARKNPQKYYDLVEKDTKTWELVKSGDGVFLYKNRSWNLE